MDETVYVDRIKYWNVTKHPSEIPGIEARYTLHGRWASSEKLVFFLLNPENAVRMQSGNPPVVDYVSQDGTITWLWPAVGGVYGLVRPKPEVQGMPTSLSGLALQLFERAAIANRPPVPVTIAAWVEAECNCTEAEASRLAIRPPQQ
jgi:hypothetical protein